MKRFFLIVALVVGAFVASDAFATLPATGIINIRSTATAGNLNGGGFNSARSGTDYTLQDAAQTTNTDGSAAGGTTFTSLLGAFTDEMKGNYIHLTASTGLTVGWYEIVSVTDSDNVELDRTPGTGNATTYYVGGAMSLASTLDDDLFEIGVPGNIFYIKGGVTYTLGEAVGITAAGGASNPIVIRGYTTTFADWTTTTGANRPTLAIGTSAMTFGTNWNESNLIITTTNTSAGVTLGVANVMSNCKVINTGTNATANAVTMASDTRLLNCEVINYRGDAVSIANIITAVMFCWIHDSNVGITVAPNTSCSTTIIGNIIESNVVAAIQYTGAATVIQTIQGNTLFGSTNTTGIGISLATGCTDILVTNNIITGFVTGVSHADTQSVGYDNWNNYHNNDTDVTNWTKGANDTAVAPAFTNVLQVTGATATTTAGNHLVQSGATFVTSGVTAGRDYVYVISGTGVTAGIYGILTVDSETQITTDITLTANATADKVFQITTGHNFMIGTAMKALGFPGAFQGGYTTGYMDQGAVQIQAGAGGQKSWSN